LQAAIPRRSARRHTWTATVEVHDHSAQALAYVYFEDDPGRRSPAKLLIKDEARRIAVFCEQISRTSLGSVSVSGKRDFGGRDNGVETARPIQPIVSRDKRPHENPPVRRYLHDTGKSLFA
jgi:hypothetical protein